MPRKLLRVALVAAVIPALTPVISSAQTARPSTTVRTAASTPTAKPASPTLWQRLRGQKPASPTTAAMAKPGMARLVTVSDERSAADATPSDKSFELESSSDMQLLRSRSNRVRPTFGELQSQAEAAPVIRSKQATRDDFENPFPEDPPKVQRHAPVAPVQQDVATPVEAPEVAAPVESEQLANEPEAFPIDSAAPPQDVTAEYNAPQGYAPRFNRTGMMTPGAQANDVTFATPIPGRSTSSMNGMKGAAPVPPVGPAYPAPAGIARIDGAMYPAPLPGIPFDVGTTMITNPALDPHEMLYAHQYRGLYAPFYHKTYRHWVLTPFGICKSEKRVLVGTEVRVNYKSYISPCSLFFPPVTH